MSALARHRGWTSIPYRATGYVQLPLLNRTLKGDHMKCLPRTAIVGVVWVLASSAGAAGPRYSGTITGSFDSPVLSGAFLQPKTHQPVVCDNTTTARASGLRTSSVNWGSDDQGKFTPSTLTF